MAREGKTNPLSSIFMQKELLNAVTISLNGRLHSDLDWKTAYSEAKFIQQEGKKIFWQMDLGLFKQLPFPLSNQMQFQSFSLALEHFRDSLWKEFEQDSVGLCLCRSSADFSEGFPWDEKQIQNWQGWLQDHFKVKQNLEVEIGKPVGHFGDCHPQNIHLNWLVKLYCRDVVAEYLHLLTANLTDSIPLYLVLDRSSIPNLLQKARLTTLERFEPFHLILEEEESFPQANIGICLPPISQTASIYYLEIDEALQELIKRHFSFRFIPEYFLTSWWEGLDYLVVSSFSITPQGRRKLQGFCAAGGIVLTLGQPLGLPEEIPFRSFILIEK